MPYLVREQQIEDDPWTVYADALPPDVASHAIVSLEFLDAVPNAGVWLENDVELEEVASRLLTRPVLAINFPDFPDGRALTLAHLLRTRYGFKNQLRAFGAVTPDLVPFMYRCGFDAFVLPTEADAHAAIKCLTQLTSEYQSSAIQKSPKFRAATL